MIQLRIEESQLLVLRRELQEAAERLQKRKTALPGEIADLERRLAEKRAEYTATSARLEQLIGDEAHGRPGVVLIINEQLNLFGEHGYAPSASLGRRGHPAHIAIRH